MDCITTVIGILYFGAVELNPFLSSVLSTNIEAFVILKVATTIFVCLTLVQARRVLLKSSDQTSVAFVRAKKLVKVATAGVLVFLFLVVANNLIVLASAH